MSESDLQKFSLNSQGELTFNDEGWFDVLKKVGGVGLNLAQNFLKQ